MHTAAPRFPTSPMIIDGVRLAAQVREEVRRGVTELVESGSPAPGLATVLIGDDPASEVYVRNKRRQCVDVGMRDLHRHLPARASQAQVNALIEELAVDPGVSGILIQLPVPEGLDATQLIQRIPPHKDVDGLTIGNAGRLAQGLNGLRPCTPAGVIRMLDDAGIQIDGARAVVVGRSILVGRPLAQLLLERNATVTIAHRRSMDLRSVCRSADILIAAAGVQGLITADMVKPGATVIDVGIHRTPDGLRGDVDFDRVRHVAGNLSPVPGGVGPMTIAMLLANTLAAAREHFASSAAQPAGTRTA